MSRLYIRVLYNLAEDDFSVTSDIKDSSLKDILGEVVRSKIGAGKDECAPEEREVYEIKCGIDLSDDSITTSSDCGNKGLETGLLMELLTRMNEDGSVRKRKETKDGG
jgi:hypothetical protein